MSHFSWRDRWPVSCLGSAVAVAAPARLRLGARSLQTNKWCSQCDSVCCTVCVGHAHARSGVLNVILGVVLTAIFVIVVGFCIVHWRRRRKRGKKQETVTVHFLTRSAVDNDTHIGNEPSPPPVSVNGGHSLFTEQTEKVSIVWNVRYIRFERLRLNRNYKTRVDSITRTCIDVLQMDTAGLLQLLNLRRNIFV